MAIIGSCLPAAAKKVRQNEQAETAYVLPDASGVAIEISLDTIREGEIVTIHAGEMVSVDSKVVSGHAFINRITRHP